MRPFGRIAAILAYSWIGAGLASGAEPKRDVAGATETARLIVKVRPRLAAAAEAEAEAQQFLRRHGGQSLRPLYTSLARAKARMGRTEQEWIADVRGRFPARSARQRSGMAPPELGRTYVLSMAATTAVEVQRHLDLLRADPDVEYAEVDERVSINLVPNDPYYNSSGTWGQAYDDLYGLKKIGSATAWDTTAGSGVVVAVVDTGLDGAHPDIAGNVWTNAGEIPGNGIDDDGNGFVDDVHGWDFSGGDADTTDQNGHGTHVAGTIAAVGNDNVGVIGVAYQSKIMPVKGLDSSGSGYVSDLAAAIQYAADNGADVMNNSWGGLGFSQTIADAVAYAHDLGVVVVAAAGNDGIDAAFETPARLSTVVTVAALAPDDTLASFSNFGAKIDVAAPGVDILSLRASGTLLGLRVGTDYVRLNGTSMAAPHVSGVAALVLAQHPEYTNEQVRQVLRVSATDVEAPGYDLKVGFGRVDAAAALAVTDPLGAKITSPMETDGVTTGAPTPILGVAHGASFVSYTLEYGAGQDPSSWTTINSSASPANGDLGTFDPTGVPEGAYTIRLTARNLTTSFVDAVHVWLADLTPPSVAITSPADGATVTGSTTVTVSASDNQRVSDVTLLVDDVFQGRSYDPPFNVPWNSAFLSNGTHTLKVVAADVHGNLATSAPITITTANAPFQVHVTAPADGAAVSGLVTFAAEVSDPVGLGEVDVTVDDHTIAWLHTPPFTFDWNTVMLDNGRHTVQAMAFSTGFDLVRSPILSITTTNGPLVTITSPASGATVSGAVPVRIQLAPNADVSDVSLYVDGQQASRDIADPPFTSTWVTPFTANGTHTVQVFASDWVSGRSSAPILVTTSNGAPITVTSPPNGAAITGTVPVTVQLAPGITPWFVDFSVDGRYMGTVTSPPFTFAWDTVGVWNGAHTLTASVDSTGDPAHPVVSPAVAVTTSNVYPPVDPVLSVPICRTNAGLCDSGPLLKGRGWFGPEANAPNTIGGTCADGMESGFNGDESNDRIRIATLDGQPFAPGATVRVDATVWNVDEGDRLDIFYTADATQPNWALVGTLTGGDDYGPQVRSMTYVLPHGSLQAVRAQFRRFGAPSSGCDGDGLTDHDDLVFAVNGIPAASQSFFTVTPCRVLDTRNAAGPYGAPPLTGGQDRTFSLGGLCGIPATAKAISANLTVTGPTAAGDLRMYPAEQGLPNASAINFAPGQTRANNAIVLLNADRQLTVRDDQPAGATVHFILDVNGYFE